MNIDVSRLSYVRITVLLRVSSPTCHFDQSSGYAFCLQWCRFQSTQVTGDERVECVWGGMCKILTKFGVSRIRAGKDNTYRAHKANR